jgi:hypothetical protein
MALTPDERRLRWRDAARRNWQDPAFRAKQAQVREDPAFRSRLTASLRRSNRNRVPDVLRDVRRALFGR